jgi:hypothetical protein
MFETHLCGHAIHDDDDEEIDDEKIDDEVD